MVETTPVEQVMAEPEDAKARAVNESHGDDHSVNLGEPRALAKRPWTRRERTGRLRETDGAAAGLPAIAIRRPRAPGPDELDFTVGEARTPKVHDRLVNHVVSTPRIACGGR